MLNAAHPRLTVGAVNVKSGELRYFDSRDGALGLEEVMASGALPPGFPAIRVDGEAYWDGGLYSNTPLEAVLDDNPRRDSVIFGVNVWQPTGHEPESLWQVMARQKDIRYASRDDSHIARQKQIHRLRHVIRELSKNLSAEKQGTREFRELASWGCGTTMHVVRLLAPALDGEDYLKDIDFSAAGIRFRCEAGFADTRRMIERAPWGAPADPMEGRDRARAIRPHRRLARNARRSASSNRHVRTDKEFPCDLKRWRPSSAFRPLRSSCLRAFGAGIGQLSENDRKIKSHAERMLEEGRHIFRFDTYGSEAFFGDALQLHKAIAGAEERWSGTGREPDDGARGRPQSRR